MQSAAKPGTTRLDRVLVGCLAVLCALAQPALSSAQNPNPHIQKLAASGLREYLSDSYGTIGFSLVNPTGQDLKARVLTFYAGAQENQYGRDVWVPARATLKSWFSIGPSSEPPARSWMELKSILLDRSGATEHLIRSPGGQPLHTDQVHYERHEPSTTVYLDTDIDDDSQSPRSEDDFTRADAVRDLVRVFRNQGGLSARMSQVKQRFLPPIPEAFDGIDQFVLASDRIVEDVAGQQALRAWLARGGNLWIPLDLVQEESVKAVLGDAVNLQVIGRTSLTNVRFSAPSANAFRPESEGREFEQPVSFVQVLAPACPAYYSVDGWPAAFSANVGRGRVVFTTLGARGWIRPRLANDPRSRMKEFPDLPMALLPFQYLAQEFQLKPERFPLTSDDLQKFVTDQISYKVVGRTTVFIVFLCLFASLTAVTLVFARKGFAEHLGWLAPALAVVAAGVFIGLAERSRGSVPGTLALAQIVEVNPGTDTAQATGDLGAFQPSETPVQIGANDGGQFDLDMRGLEGRDHLRIQTDADRWHWENLELPAGVVRHAPFQYSLALPAQVGAQLRFGAQGVEGHAQAGTFQNLGDALLLTPGRHALPTQLGADGRLDVSAENGLQTGQLIRADLLSDRQRERQGLYQKLLADPQPRFLGNQNLLLAWGDPVNMHFTLVDQARLAGAALVLLPVQFERTPPGSVVTIPEAFVECRRVDNDGHLLEAAFESRLPATVRLRFQLPASVLPMTIEQARFRISLHAPGREVTLQSGTPGGATIRTLDGVGGVQQIELTDPSVLQVDPQGVLYFNIVIGPIRGRVERDTWRIEWPGLEVKGKT